MPGLERPLSGIRVSAEGSGRRLRLMKRAAHHGVRAHSVSARPQRCTSKRERAAPYNEGVNLSRSLGCRVEP